jgi:hypothetical protein
LKIYCWLILFLGVLLALPGCSGGGGGDTPVGPVVSTLTVAPNQSVIVGHTANLAFTARTSSGQDVTSQIANRVVWSSSNSAILQASGLAVTGVSPGTASVAVSYMNANGTQVDSQPVMVTVESAGSSPQARAFVAIPDSGPYQLRFDPTTGAPFIVTSNATLGTFTNYVSLPSTSGAFKAFLNGVQRSSRTLTLEQASVNTVVIAGTSANTVLVPFRDRIDPIDAGEFRLRFVMGYVASRRTFDIYLLRPGQTVEDVTPIRENRAFETGFVTDLNAGVDRFALTVPGTKTLVFSGTIESPAGSNIIVVVDETATDTFRFQYWGQTGQ